MRHRAAQATLSRRRSATETLLGTGVNTLLVAVQAVVLVPLFLGAVGDRLYGAWLGSGDVLVWLQALDLGLPNLMIQRIGVLHSTDDQEGIADLYGSSLAVLLLLATLVAIAAIVIAPQMASWLGVTGVDADTLVACFRVAAVATATMIVTNAALGYSRGVQDTKFLAATMVIGGATSLLVSLGAVLSGLGLWSIVLGIVARAIITVAGSVVFTLLRQRAGVLGPIRVRSSHVTALLRVAPATALGGISYSLMNQSENVLAAMILGPAVVPMLTFTRKIVEVGRGLLDTIGYSTYGAFAHLNASAERGSARRVLGEIISLRTALAVSLGVTYLIVNRSFVSLWVGSEYYGGMLLTGLMTLQLLTVGNGFLLNYLQRASGDVVHGSIALFLEALVRTALVAALLAWVGLPGVPVAGVVTSIVASVWSYRRLNARLESSEYAHPILKGHTIALYLGLLFIATWVGARIDGLTWSSTIVLGCVVAAGSLLALYAADAALRNTLQPFVARWMRVKELDSRERNS